MKPVLGFGTAPVLGRVSKRKSLAAIESAYANGIRHFDTARSYGWGQSETVLGEFLAAHPREEFRIVTKCGLMPVRHSWLLGVSKSAARLAVKAVPALRRTAQRVAASSAYRPTATYNVAELARSLEQSLTQLRSSYVDILLLHNFDPATPGIEDVVTWFRSIQKQGLIRRFGFSVEGDLPSSLKFLRDCGVLDDCVVQTPITPQFLSLGPEWRSVHLIGHSPFRYLQENEDATSDLATLVRRLGAVCECEAIVCSMFTRSHLEANVAAWRDIRM